MRSRAALLAFLVLAGALLGVSPAVEAGSRIPRGNLVKNPGFDEGALSDGSAPTAPEMWQVDEGSPVAMSYVHPLPGYPGSDTAELVGGGAGFFAGSAEEGEPSSSVSQTIRLSKDVRRAIDKGGVFAFFSAQLGGFGSQDDRASLVVRALDDGGEAGGELIEGPTAAERSGETGFHHLDGVIALDPGVDAMEVRVIATRANPFPTNPGANDGYADNIWLGLRSQRETRGISLSEGSSPVGGALVVFARIGPVGAHIDDVPVKLMQVRPGRDRVVAQGVTTDGSVGLGPVPEGRYYALTADGGPQARSFIHGD
jgi:hypothetical protein